MALVTTLYEPPNSVEFSPDAKGRALLQTHLDRLLRDTNIATPESVRAIRLDARTLSTQMGFRYSAYAFSRVCRIMAPGLSKVVQNISGEARPTDLSADLFSRPAACNVFNEIANLRFNSLLSNYQMVLDVKARRIEGFLGPKTHYLEVSSFLELAESIIVDTGDGVEFAGASLVGRRLFIRYLKTEEIDTHDGVYRQGYAFCIDEAGDDAIRAYLLYRREECGSSCLQAPAKFRQRQRRTGSRFAIKLRQLLAGVLRPEPLDIEAAISELSYRTLFDEQDENYILHVRKKWIQIFRLSNVPADTAEAVVHSIFMPKASLGSALSTAQVMQKTEYDLFQALTLYAKDRGQRMRELLESVAFQVFLRG